MTELEFKENGSPKNIDFDLVTLQDGGWEKVGGEYAKQLSIIYNE